jgi:hypothetical protein
MQLIIFWKESFKVHVILLLMLILMKASSKYAPWEICVVQFGVWLDHEKDWCDLKGE